MPESEYFGAIWYTEFLGIGYIQLPKVGWHVFPIFTNTSDAEKIWIEQIEPLDEKSLKMRFVEYGSEYKFILYPFPWSKEKTNFCFYRSLGSSETYNVFKKNFDGRVYFTFGKFGNSQYPILLRNSKLVTDIRFMKSSEVKPNSIEWIAEDVQRRMRAKYG
jgi:hypothetical protein